MRSSAYTVTRVLYTDFFRIFYHVITYSFGNDTKNIRSGEGGSGQLFLRLLKNVLSVAA